MQTFLCGYAFCLHDNDETSSIFKRSIFKMKTLLKVETFKNDNRNDNFHRVNSKNGKRMRYRKEFQDGEHRASVTRAAAKAFSFSFFFTVYTATRVVTLLVFIDNVTL